MKVTRWPAILIFALLIVASLSFNLIMKFLQIQSSEKSTVSSWGYQESFVNLVLRGRKCWRAGLANHEILIGNPSDAESSVLISVVSVLAPISKIRMVIQEPLCSTYSNFR
ncbi:MAG: hypothetical protein CM15mP49_10870 [Actinomycetota bacterium]|nr:MAG: hypothetical protein CM15mP49_10870 [Actinomycetota bacterium]